MVKTSIWDTSKHLKTKKDVGEFLKILLEEMDYKTISIALYDVVRVRGGITKFSKEVKIPADLLSKIITGEEEITLSVLIKILHFFKLDLTVK